MDEHRLRIQIRTASLALLVGGIAAVAVAFTTPTPARAFLPLVGAGIVIYGSKLALDSWTVPEWAWQAPLVAAIIVRLDPDPTTIYWTGGSLAVVSLGGFLLAAAIASTLGESDSE